MKIPSAEDFATYAYNPYYYPEKWGMEEVDHIDYSSGSYEFDYRVVWKDEKGALWSAQDSGCSCPTPFEDIRGKADFERVTAKWIEHVLEPELKERAGRAYGLTSRQECDDFLWEVKKALRKSKVH